MKLTKREKWLMQKAWDNGINRTDCNDMQEWLGIVDYGSMIESILRQAPNPESIVKTVDADNLPAGEVLAIDSTKEVMLSSYLWADAFSTVWAENDIENMNVITHYIEQKDLIKMISGV